MKFPIITFCTASELFVRIEFLVCECFIQTGKFQVVEGLCQGFEKLQNSLEIHLVLHFWEEKPTETHSIMTEV